MIKLPNALKAWLSADFENVLKQEIEQLDPEMLPLQQGLSQGDFARLDKFTAMVIKVSETVDSIDVKIGIFYQGLMLGCGCADDPTPDNEFNEYCECIFVINKATAESKVSLLQ